MATTHPHIESPAEAAARRRLQLTAPAHVPVDEEERVALADMVQAYVGDVEDPSHATWTRVHNGGR